MDFLSAVLGSLADSWPEGFVGTCTKGSCILPSVCQASVRQAWGSPSWTQPLSLGGQWDKNALFTCPHS